MHTRQARPRDIRLVVVEEHRLRRRDPEALADEGIDRRLGLAHSALVRVDDLIDEVLESVRGLLAFPGADEAVTQDSGAVARAQPAGVVDQFRVGGAEVLTPQVSKEVGELLLIEAQALGERPVHLLFADRADAAAVPGVGHALVQLAGAQAEPGLPRLADVMERAGRDLKHAADVEHNRLDRHARHADLYPGGKVKGTCGAAQIIHLVLLKHLYHIRA